MGGETYRVRSTGYTRSRPDRSRPCTPHHNAKKAWRCNAHKKTAGAVMRLCSQQAAKPGTRFMRCSGNVPQQNIMRQAVFLWFCIHTDGFWFARKSKTLSMRIMSSCCIASGVSGDPGAPLPAKKSAISLWMSCFKVGGNLT